MRCLQIEQDAARPAIESDVHCQHWGRLPEGWRGRGNLSAESISLVLARPDDHTDKESKEELAQLQAARAADVFTDERSVVLLHHVLGLD